MIVQPMTDPWRKEEPIISLCEEDKDKAEKIQMHIQNKV